ncbi:hypothetical protein [Aliivibrio fischeri]|uniref:hypothetical protein n=1 Tax=Aliivibrio fischeri TaxID=668 RepID=UPI0007C4C500|nr:hypothetical protein [Aliivibrio fischeri]
MINEEYYVWTEDCQFGLLDATDEYTETIQNKRELVSINSNLKYKITCKGDSDLVPDVYYSPKFLVGKKIQRLLLDLNLDYIQLIPASIENKSEEFYLLKIINFISLIDEKNSKVMIKRGNIKNVDKIKLSNELLNIQLIDRLIFKIGHSPVTLIHKSIVNELLTLNLQGVRFIPVLSWNSWSITK